MINAIPSVSPVQYRRYPHPNVPPSREREAGNVVAYDDRFRCPDCNRALQINYGTISCMACRRHGEPGFWIERGVRISRNTESKP